MNATYDGTAIPTWNADMDSPIIQQFSPRSSELYGGMSRIESVYDGQTVANMLTIPPATYGRSEAVSPIYGLNGTLRGGRYSPYTTNPPANFDIPSTRSSGLENLFREQSELEKSIAALRLLASSPADPRSSQAISVASERGVDPEFMTVPPRSGPESASVRSEFSLSSFPQPPEARRSSRSKSMLSVELLPPRMPAAMTTIAEMQSLPSSARNSEDTLQLNIGQGGRFESAGTQFDVTSFIEGEPSLCLKIFCSISNLMINTGHKKGNSSLSALKPSPVDADADSDIIDSATIVTVERQISSTRRAQVVRVNTNTTQPPPTDNVAPAPGDSSSNPPSPDTSRQSPTKARLAGKTPIMDAGGRIVGLPARPKLGKISAPLRQSMEEPSPTAFQRPRPPPLVL
ncbi:hypothetical protein EVG20_g7907 [Dentipellis fragilis]|uniref:Uncharacterized protein n=1 Tax=Dentipellis fragilis TaxID=205917 RepID=A0A4Y9Y9B5_9AGAM|nr:hypothetical protein EVG20_g7907 [Dentipellis fragilis]